MRFLAKLINTDLLEISNLDVRKLEKIGLHFVCNVALTTLNIKQNKAFPVKPH